MNSTSNITTAADFRENGHDGSLICNHRDLGCCKACAEAHEEIVEVFGAHFWIADAAERAELAAMA
jgi:hypothetical protein